MLLSRFASSARRRAGVQILRGLVFFHCFGPCHANDDTVHLYTCSSMFFALFVATAMAKVLSIFSGVGRLREVRGLRSNSRSHCCCNAALLAAMYSAVQVLTTTVFMRREYYATKQFPTKIRASIVDCCLVGSFTSLAFVSALRVLLPCVCVIP